VRGQQMQASSFVEEFWREKSRRAMFGKLGKRISSLISLGFLNCPEKYLQRPPESYL